jgi:hypothetical protein
MPRYTLGIAVDTSFTVGHVVADARTRLYVRDPTL